MSSPAGPALSRLSLIPSSVVRSRSTGLCARRFSLLLSSALRSSGVLFTSGVSCLVLLCTLLGCGARGGATSSSVIPPRYQTMHFDREGVRKIHSITLMPVIVEPDVPEGAARINEFNKIFREAAEQLLDIQLTAPGKLPVATLNSTSMAAISRELAGAARAQGGDAALIAVVHQARERRGAAIGVSNPNPAVFAVNLSLYSVKSATPVWEGSYVFRDEAIDLNLLRIGDTQRSGEHGFLSLNQLAHDGFRRALDDLHARRLEAFQR